MNKAVSPNDLLWVGRIHNKRERQVPTSSTNSCLRSIGNDSRWQEVSNKLPNGKILYPCRKSRVAGKGNDAILLMQGSAHQRKQVVCAVLVWSSRKEDIDVDAVPNDKAENPIDQCSLLTHPWDIPLFCCSENKYFLLAPTCGYNLVVFLYFTWSYFHFHCRC
jgi:hypothetical protein